MNQYGDFQLEQVASFFPHLRMLERVQFSERLFSFATRSESDFTKILTLQLFLIVNILKVYAPYFFAIISYVASLLPINDEFPGASENAVPVVNLEKYSHFLDDKEVIIHENVITKLLKNGYRKYRFVSRGFLLRNSLDPTGTATSESDVTATDIKKNIRKKDNIEIEAKTSASIHSPKEISLSQKSSNQKRVRKKTRHIA